MKVLMWVRMEYFDLEGGDKIQIENTAAELRKLGVEVDISADTDVDLSGYDVVHVFQLDWTPETYLHVNKAKKFGKPIVLSPIHHRVSEVKRFDDEYTFGWRRLTKYFFREQHNRDVWKNIYRSVFNLRKLKPTLLSLVIGFVNMHRKTLGMVDKVLVQTELEAKDLKDTYGVDFSWIKVPNGVGEHFLHAENEKNQFDFENYILCVGRIEARKNNLNIIKAVKLFREKNNLNTKLVFVGSLNRSDPEYTFWFARAVRRYSWLVHVLHTPNERMAAIFKFAKVCVSASWFETTGLTLLEALFCGTNAVASGPRAKEYLGEYATYCDPGDVTSIATAIDKEYFAPRPKISDTMKKTYTWSFTAQKVYEVYNSLTLAKS